MAVSLKQELEINAAAVNAFDAGDYSAAYEQFETIAEYSSKVRFNMGIILATIGQHEDAIAQYEAALRMDRYLAVAYFQAGVSNFLLSKFEEAQSLFDDAYLYLRGNAQIDYEQLGLKFKLYSCEVLFNRGLCSIHQGNAFGLQDLQKAALEQLSANHSIIDRAIRDKGLGHNIFMMPANVLYRPDEAKLRNIAAKDYLGKARLIASIDSTDIGTGFRGYERANSSASSTSPRTLASSASSEVSTLLSRFSFASRANSQARIDKHMDHAREMEFSRLDEALVRKASTSSVRGNFPPPTRSRSLFKRGRDLPPTPPRTDSRASSRKSSYASSTLSERQASPLTLQSMFRSHTVASSSSIARSLPRILNGHPEKRVWSPKLLPFNDTKSNEAFAKHLATLSLDLPEKSPSANPHTRKSSVTSSSTLSHTPSSIDEDDGGDLIDDYYSQTSFSASSSSSSGSGSSRNPSISVKSIRIKVHGLEDTRVITIDARNTFLPQLHFRLRDKFGWTTIPKLRTRDEDDELILLQDQEDFSICLETAVLDAQRACKDVGKLEIWVAS